MNPETAAKILDLDATTAAAMRATIEATVSPASTIRQQLLVTLANLGQAFPEIHSGARQMFAIVVLEAHPAFAGQTVL